MKGIFRGNWKEKDKDVALGAMDVATRRGGRKKRGKNAEKGWTRGGGTGIVPSCSADGSRMESERKKHEVLDAGAGNRVSWSSASETGRTGSTLKDGAAYDL